MQATQKNGRFFDLVAGGCRPRCLDSSPLRKGTKPLFKAFALVALALFCTLLSLERACWAGEGQLVIASTPWKAPEVLEEMHRPLLQYISHELGLETLFLVASDYEELGERLEARAVDVGLFSPNAYVQAKKRYPDLQYLATVLKRNAAGEAQDHYQGYIVALTSSSIRTLEDLKGKRFGFTDPQSTSGYLYPRLLLQQNGIDPETDFSRTFLLKKHDKVLKAVLKGSIDAGACYDDVFREMDRKHPGMLRIIAKTPEIPFDAYAAGAHVPEHIILALRKALGSFTGPPAEKPEMLGSPYSFVVRNDAFYDVVRQANDRIR